MFNVQKNEKYSLWGLWLSLNTIYVDYRCVGIFRSTSRHYSWIHVRPRVRSWTDFG